jgi:hypothetical protein
MAIQISTLEEQQREYIQLVRTRQLQVNLLMGNLQSFINANEEIYGNNDSPSFVPYSYEVDGNGSYATFVPSPTYNERYNGSIFVRREQNVSHVDEQYEDIQNTTLKIEFSEINNNEDIVCPIDLDQLTEGDDILKIKHCGHIFRESNIRLWFNTNFSCPLCRHDLSNNI